MHARLFVEPFPDRALPSGTPLVVGAAPGTPLEVTLPTTATVTAYDPNFTGGVNVAAADITGDGVADVVTGPGGGGGPVVKVIDGATGAELRSLMAFDPGFRGGVSVAADDVTGDGVPDIIAGAGPGGGPVVKVFDGRTGAEVLNLTAFEPGFTGGVAVAAGDVDGDNVPDVVVGAGPGGGPVVKAFDAHTGRELASLMAFDPGFRGGVSVATADITGDGIAELVVGAGPGGGPHVVVLGRTGVEVYSFFAFPEAFTGGVRLAVADLNGDFWADLVVGPGSAGGGPVRAFSGRAGSALDPALTAGLPADGAALAGADVGRWDALLRDSEWFVPAANLLAYLVPAPLADPIPIADQTLWNITAAAGGNFQGTEAAQFSIVTPVGLIQPDGSTSTMDGVVTPDSRIRITFTSANGQPPITGLGAMRYVDGSWRMNMQMSTGTTAYVTHWAYMTRVGPGTPIPAAVSPPPSGDLRADVWGWLLGTDWAITDTELLAEGGQFHVDGFRNGYFWGAGTAGGSSFAVVGSATPEGSLFLTLTLADGTGVQRTGVLTGSGAGDGRMKFRSYEGDPEFGAAVGLIG